LVLHNYVVDWRIAWWLWPVGKFETLES
jgi:hypothetical protein